MAKPNLCDSGLCETCQPKTVYDDTFPTTRQRHKMMELIRLFPAADRIRITRHFIGAHLTPMPKEVIYILPRAGDHPRKDDLRIGSALTAQGPPTLWPK